MGCTSTPPKGSGDPIEVLVTAEPETLDPRVSTDPVAMRVTRLIHAGLARLDPDTLLPVPYVAAAWSWRSPRALEVTLRSDVTFANGAAVTAADVRASIQAYQAPFSRHQRVVDAIGEVEAEDATHLVIHLKREHATLLSDLELPILRADQAFSPPNTPLLGLGPFRLGVRDRGSVELVPRAGGALAKPAHAVIVRTLRDENARALRVRSGETDVSVNAFSPTLLPERVQVGARPGANLTYLLIRDGDRTPHVVRSVLSYAIDRERITQTLFAGYATPAQSIFPKGHWAYAEHANRYPYSMQDARTQLLRHGYRTDGTDPRLRFTLHTSTDRLRQSIARFLKQELAEIGITLDLVPLELGTMIARLGDGNFELAILQIPELTEPNALRTFLHSQSVPPIGSNRGRVHDETLDHWLDLGASTLTFEARREVYREVEQRVSESLPIIPLWHEQWVTVTSPRAQGFRPSAEGRWLGLATLP